VTAGVLAHARLHDYDGVSAEGPYNRNGEQHGKQVMGIAIAMILRRGMV